MAMKPVDRLLATARAEIGYIEKETNAHLDDKTANAGDGNWNKYARDLDALGVVYNGKKNGYAWCDIFTDWCFIQTFGLELGLQLLCQAKKGVGAGCSGSANYYKQKGQFHTSGPQPGDQIFFTKDGGKSFYHTGIVEKVAGGRVYTIEGNTSSAAGVVENGGCVRDKSYPLTYSKIAAMAAPIFPLYRRRTTIWIKPSSMRCSPLRWRSTESSSVTTTAATGARRPESGPCPWAYSRATAPWTTGSRT